MFCREWLAQLERHKHEIESAGLRSVAVGLGQPKHALRYCPSLAPSATCVVGHGTEAHIAYGLKRGGLLQLAGPQVIASGVRATSKGIVQGATTGDPTMLSGTFVVDQDGVIQYAFYSANAGDHPDLGEVLTVVESERFAG